MTEDETAVRSVCIDISADHPEAMAAWARTMADFSEALISEEGATIDQLEAFLQAGNGWYYTRSSQSEEVQALEAANPLLYPESLRFGRAQYDRDEQVKFCEETISRLEDRQSNYVFSSEKDRKVLADWKSLAQKVREAPPPADEPAKL